jgi:hypothetical protein
MSGQIPIIPATKLDISKVNITKPRKNKDGKIVAYLNYGESGFMIETPTMHSFGVAAFKDEKKGIESKHRLTCTRRPGGTETEENVNNFFEFLRGLDEKMIDFLIENSQMIFKEKYDESDRKIVASNYKKYRIIKEKKDEKTGEMYPPNFRVGFMTMGDERKGEELTPMVSLLKGKTEIAINSFADLEEHVPKNSSVRVVIQPRIYILSDIAGVRFTARFMKVPEVSKMAMPTKFQFSDSSDGADAPVAEGDDEEAEEEQQAEEEDEEGAVEDSDEDA